MQYRRNGVAVTDSPFKTDENGDSDESGRFMPGCKPGPGRPRGPDFREVVLRRRSAEVVESDLLEVYDALAARAKTGDVQAARLFLERVAPEPPAALLVAEARRGARGRTLEEIIGGSWNPGELRPLMVVTGVPEPKAGEA